MGQAEKAPAATAATPVFGSDGFSEPFSGPFCPVCRRPNRSVSVFCAHCGHRLKQTAPAQGGHAYALPHVAAAPSRQAGPISGPMPPFSVAADVTGSIAPGTVLKRRYRVLRKVAQGGMGAVYESTDITANVPGNRWAVKEISPAALPPGERAHAVADFRREAQMLAALHHPNLVTVVETFEEWGKHFLVMEFVPGHSLLNVLDNYAAPMSETRVLVWTRQMLDVIQYLHSQDPPVIYRDVKPANIMLVEGTERIKLIDFGIARLHKADKSQDTEAFGTAGYAPPEQYGKGQTDQRSDIYALAATLHQLLTNRDPSLNPFNWLPVKQYNPTVSARVNTAVMDALNLDPQRRYRSIAAFAQALGIGLPPIEEPAAPPVSRYITPDQAKQNREQAAPTKQKPAAQPGKKSGPQTQSPRPVVWPMPEIAPTPFAIPQYIPAAQETDDDGQEAAISMRLQEAGPSPAGQVAEAVQTQEAPAPPADALKAEAVAESEAQAADGNEGKLSSLLVSDRMLDLGDTNWNRRPMRRVQIKSAGGERLEGNVLASQPWIAYNPTHFRDSAVTLEVKVRRRQLRFGQLELQVPNLFAIIWARTRRFLPFIGCWFWLLLLVASSLGRMLLWALGATLGLTLLAEGLLWLWSFHVRLLVPTERVNVGRLWVKSSGGDQQIEVRVTARPSRLRRAAGWTMASVLLATEALAVAWLVLTLTGFPISDLASVL